VRLSVSPGLYDQVMDVNLRGTGSTLLVDAGMLARRRTL
jgi:hypothetical protein